MSKVNEIKLLKMCGRLRVFSTPKTNKQLSTYKDTPDEFQTLQIMQYIKQEEVLRNGDFQIQVINRSLFAIKR